jgi:hypothetical protein
MKAIQNKIERLAESEQIPSNQVFAVPGESNIIDVVKDGKSAIYGEALEQIQARHPGAVLMDYDQWAKEKASRQDTPIEWQPTTKERYWEMLEVLPPAIMLRGGFLVGEPWDHHAINGKPRFQAYIARYGEFFVASRPMTIAEFKEVLI